MKKTKVSFYKDSFGVFAYFPEEEYGVKDLKVSYQHVGQHSAVAPDYLKSEFVEKATIEEYQDLKEELKSIGYDLDIL